MKNRKVKMLLAYVIGIMPTSKVRVLLYRTLFNYRIHKSYIGWNTTVAVNSAEFNECSISRNNKFFGPMKVTIDKGTSVGPNNTFFCGWWTEEEQFKEAGYKRNLQIGTDAMITSKHYFDVVGAFFLGDNSWIAGNGSQFWTHGAGATDHDISIGEGCYIGSAVRFAPGSSVANNSIVGLGSVVTKRFTSENVIIAGQPAKVLRENYDWKTKQDML